MANQFFHVKRGASINSPVSHRGISEEPGWGALNSPLPCASFVSATSCLAFRLLVDLLMEFRGEELRGEILVADWPREADDGCSPNGSKARVCRRRIRSAMLHCGTDFSEGCFSSGNGIVDHELE